MAKFGLGAYLETHGTEVRAQDARRWRRAVLALGALLLAQLELLAIALSWDTPLRVTVVAACAALSALAALGAGFMYWEYARLRRVEEQRTLATTDAHAAAEPGRPLDPQQAWLLLPVALVALLNPQATLRLALGAWALWRNAHEPPRSKE